MSRIRGRDTGPELRLAKAMEELGCQWETHCRDLPGRPDFALRDERIAIFVDGDFWHGWRFPQWRHKLSEKWEKKIQATRDRDRRNHKKLRRLGWIVVRIWEHQLERDPARCVERIQQARTRRADQQHQSE